MRLPYNRHQVLKIQNDTKSLIGNYKDKEHEIFISRIAELRGLAEALKKDEETFYENFKTIKKIPGGAKTSIERLQKLLISWNDCFEGETLFLNNRNIINGILKLQDPELKSVVLTLEEQLFSRALKKDANVVSRDTLGSALQKVVKAMTTQGFLHKYGESNAFKKQGLQNILTVFKDEGKLSIKVDKKLSPHYQKRIEKLFNTIVKKERDIYEKESAAYNELGSSEGGQKGIVSFYILENLPPKAKKTYGVRDAFAVELNANFDKYDLGYNLAGVKGFLGELYWGAFFRYIGTDVVPIGSVKNLIGQKIPIDFLINNFGFQVKNYTLRQKNYVQSGSITASGFITSRAQVDLGGGKTVAEILMQFFGSYGYNRPVATADKEYRKIYENFPKIARQTQSVFEKYIDRIMDIQKFFGVNKDNANGFIGKPAMYRNTFFLIGDKIIPSSAIIYALIDELKAAERKEVIKLSLSFQLSEEAKYMTYPEKPPKGLLSFDKAAKDVAVNFRVKVNVENIIERAFGAVTKNNA